MEDCKIKVANAIVIDDKPEILQLAEEIGLAVIQSCLLGNNHEFLNHFHSIKELLELCFVK